MWCLLPALSQPATSDSGDENPTAQLPLSPVLYGITQWHPGESSEYLFITFRAGRKEVKRIRYAVLSEQIFGTSRYFLVENQITSLNDERRTTINAVLRPFGDLTNLLEGATGDFITKQDTAPARAIPIRLLKDQLLPFEMTARLPKIAEAMTLDSETIESHAGKIKTTHQRLRFEDGRAVEVWWSGSMGPLGLVRAVAKGFSLELKSHQAKHSASAITEIPQSVVNP